MSVHYSITQMPPSERPRERLLAEGAESLSSAELLAILLGSGTQKMPVLQLAQELIVRFNGLAQLADATIEELCQINGIGQAKAIQIKACFALGSRACRQTLSPRYKIEHPSHAYHLLRDQVQNEKREHFLALFLDTKNQLITHQVIAIGTLSETLVHPREVFYPAIRHKAARIIVAHNHPSGDPTPSQHDYSLTKSLVATGRLIGIPVTDHLIIGGEGFISLRQKGFSFD